MTDLASVQVMVYGLVQGVYFRDFTVRRALGLDLTGYAQNLPAGTVEVQAEGERKQLEKLIDCLRAGPPAARVTEVVTSWSEYTGRYASFRIKP